MDYRSLVCAALVLSVGCKRSEPAPTEEEPLVKPVDIDDPQSCAPCHALVVVEWERSMHSRAAVGLDPIFAGIRDLRMKREGQAIGKVCETCHSPRLTVDESLSPLMSGVTCASCHNVAAVHAGKQGTAALEWSNGTLLTGPNNVSKGVIYAHETGPAPTHITDGRTICLACHQDMKSKTGVSICTTGVEHTELAGAETCVGCHMPIVQRASGSQARKASHRSHEFFGPHHLWKPGATETSFAASAVDLVPVWMGANLTVTLTNKTGHSFPSGFPGRQAFVEVTGADEAGRPTWTAPPRGLIKRYVDVDGKPTLAPWAARLEKDTRLEPGEARPLSYTVPPEVKTVTVFLTLRLLPASLARKIGLGDTPESAPRTVVTRTVRRSNL